MTNRYLSLDIRDFIITKLTNEFNAMIGTINTERTHSSPSSNSFTYKWGQNQFPFILVDIQSSEAIYDDPATPMTLNYTTLPEVYTALVTGFLKSNTDNIFNWSEDWIEAIIRILHNHNDSNITWIAYTKCEKVDFYDKENENIKVFSIEFEVRIN